MQLFAWIGICIVFAVLARKHPMTVVVVVLATRILVPSVAVAVITGPNGAFHPATWLLLMSFSAVVLTSPRQLWRVIQASALLYAVGSFVLIQCLIVTTIFIPSDLIGLINTFGSVLLLFALIQISVNQGGLEDLKKLRLVILGLAVVESLFAAAQVALGSAILFSAQYATNYWFDPSSFGRAFGTLDSPLDLAMLVSVATPLIRSVNRLLVRTCLVGVLLVGILSTQSRLGLVLVVAGGAYAVLPRQGRLTTALVGLLGFGGLLFIFASSPLATGAISRFTDDNESSADRNIAYAYLFDRGDWHLLYGGGLGSSYSLRTSGVLSTSLENGYAMFAFDCGLVAAGALLVTSFWLTRFWDVRSRVFYQSVAGVFAVITALSYSGLETQSAASTILMVSLGLSYCSIRGDKRRAELHVAPTHLSELPRTL